MRTSEWARTTISVFHSSGEVAENVDLPGDTLTEQLAAAEDWLVAVDPGRLSGPGGGVRLLASWTPAPDSRAMSLPDSLVKALAEARGTFWLDVYAPGREDQSAH